jgi:hypothetical protein
MTKSTQYENYASNGDPSGQRYVGIKGHTPPWAVDVKPGDGKIRNDWGLEVHVTDKYVHCSLPVTEAENLMTEMRNIWERAQYDRASVDDIMFMIDAVTNYERLEVDATAAGDA